MVSKVNKLYTEGDPLAYLIAPPPNETEDQRQARIAAEAEAKRISDAIDEELQQQAKAEKRAPRIVKILLLGQSESGKSTTLKNFQLMNTPKAFRAERSSWRAVVLLNVVRSIRVILETMADVQAQQAFLNSSPTRTRAPELLPSPVRTHPPDLSHSPSISSLASRYRSSPLTTEHLKLKLRLAPLVQVEEALIRKLTPPGSNEMEATQLRKHGSLADRARALDKEVAVNSQFAWKGVFVKMINRNSSDEDEYNNDPDDPSRIIHACAEDMITLWKDLTIRAMLRSQGIRLEDMPGFFLDSLERVTNPKYVPIDDDILRARLKTLGVSEHRFTVKEGYAGAARDLRIYDVGGHRSLRAAWAPFFDDMNAILFLAPLSGFDQVLAEDETVNRLEDSVLLWKSICSNPLLGKTNLILFLNKIDIFRSKLDAGISFGQYIISYGNRPNDYDSTSAYMRRKFGQIHKEYSPHARNFYCHFTSVLDTKSTTNVLVNVQEMIIVANLKSINLAS